MAALVLTVVGDDQAGLVDALSGVIAEHGGNWEKSHMTELAGKFAGIVMVTAPSKQTDALIEALRPLEDKGLLDITVARAGADEPPRRVRRLSLELLGQDHPGIVHDISHALASHNVSISELRTETRSAPMTGEMLFEAKAFLEVPEDLALDELIAGLEAMANELMVDIELHSGPEDD